MNVHYKFSFASLLTTTAFSLLLSVVTLSNANADPCFDDPKRAYEYLVAKEKAVIQAREQKVININRANEGELVSLDGIGSSKAQAIILYRDMFGDFKTVGELAKVKGIGAKTVEKNQRRLSVRD
ncbi:ComEA family DNA-binding protein [Psychrobacter sp. AOP7-D1-21]|uniref:ComEA family DNA-binding protein n=1 Tax=Psychrobacter sp. AOP7-D1-21 TaxID=3457636 RepID=UPI003FB812FC